MSRTGQNKTKHKRKWTYPFTEENLPQAEENSTIPKKGAYSTRKQKEQLPCPTVLSLHAIAVFHSREEDASLFQLLAALTSSHRAPWCR